MYDTSIRTPRFYKFEPRGSLSELDYSQAVSSFQSARNKEIVFGFVGRASTAMSEAACVASNCQIDTDTGDIYFQLDIMSEAPNGVVLLQLIEADAKMRVTADISFSQETKKVERFNSVFFVPAD